MDPASQPREGPEARAGRAGREQRLEVAEAKARESKRWAIFGLVNLSHAMNHLQTSVPVVFYPLFSQEFGIAYLGIGLISTVNQLVPSALQGTAGFFTRFAGRGVLLGVGNIVTGLGAMGLGLFTQGYSHLVAWTAVRSAGSSAQHPVGAAVLVTYFPKRRAQLLGFHQSAGNVGGWIAPILASAMLYVMGWRQIIWILAVPSLFMGLAYFAFRDLLAPTGQGAGGKRGGRAAASLADYRSALKNRNILFLSLAMLAGAAGRGTGILNTFLTLYLVKTYDISASQAGFFLSILMVGGIVGPVTLGWLADRSSRKLLSQFTLLGAALTTYTIIYYPSVGPLLAIHVFLAGVFIWGRGPLIEALFTQATDRATLDTLLSIYYAVAFASGPIWTLVTGLVIDRYGIPPAFGLMAGLYLLGMFFLSFVQFGPRGQPAEASA